MDVAYWRQKNSLAAHIVNMNNPMMMKGPYREIMPAGPYTVSLAIPAGAKVGAVKLLESGAVPKTIARRRPAGGGSAAHPPARSGGGGSGLSYFFVQPPPSGLIYWPAGILAISWAPVAWPAASGVTPDLAAVWV